ncbi:MAG: tyrosine-protein phosphatase [Dehalococcoidia bacterium]|nr:tyrosine-protein phosphatase [Dehalococcoidia bacterium]
MSRFLVRRRGSVTNTRSVAPRVLDDVVEGAVNFRDLGGYHTADGLVVRSGLVYRSGMMHTITPAGLVTLREALGIRTVVDLRNAQELDADGTSPFEDYGVEWRNAPIGGETVTTPEERRERVREYVANTVDWCDAYVRMTERNPAAFRDLFEAMANAASTPLVFHCSGGRDRTGVGAALLFSSLGVDDETIARDYALTGDLLQPHVDRFRRQMEAVGMTHESWARLLETSADAMRRFLAWLREEHGGAESYLRATGVPGPVFDAARRHLLQLP